MAENGSDFGTWVGGFILGIVTGAAVALLMAPQTGEETREIIQEKGQTLRTRAMDTVQEAKSQVGTVADRAKDRFSTLQERGRDFIQEGKQVTKETARDAKEATSQVTDTARGNAQDIMG